MERSKVKSRTEWAEIIVEQARSGLSAKAFCKTKAIGLASFYQWRRRIFNEMPDTKGNEKTRVPFIEMGQVDAGELSVSLEVTVELGNGARLMLRRG